MPVHAQPTFDGSGDQEGTYLELRYMMFYRNVWSDTQTFDPYLFLWKITLDAHDV